MKKLMIAAAAAAMIGGAYAGLPEVAPDGDGVGTVYNLAFTVKTLETTTSSKVTVTGCKVCPDADVSICATLAPVTIKINGVLAMCGCDDAELKAVLWYGSGKKATPFTQEVYTPASYEYLLDFQDAGVEEFAVNRYTAKLNKAQINIKIANEIDSVEAVMFANYTAATYKYNKDDDEYTLKTTAKLSGSGVGLATHAVDSLYVEQEVYQGGFVADDYICTVETAACNLGDGSVVARGTASWSIKTGSANTSLTKIVPSAIWED